MKRVMIIVMAFITVTAFAQERKGPRKGQDTQEKSIFKDLSPEEMATLQMKQMTLDLDLTQAQQTEIYQMKLAEVKMHRAKMEERKKMMETQKGEKPSKEEHFKRMNEGLDSKIAHKNKMKQVLNNDQFEKWQKGNKRKQLKHKKVRQKSRRRN